MRTEAKRNSTLLVASECHNLAQGISFRLIFCSVLWALVLPFVYIFLTEIIKCVLREWGGGRMTLTLTVWLAYHCAVCLHVVTSSFLYGLRMDCLPTVI